MADDCDVTALDKDLIYDDLWFLNLNLEYTSLPLKKKKQHNEMLLYIHFLCPT